MTFLEHLDELRARLIRCLLAVGAGVVVAFPFRKSLYNLLLTPQNLRVQTLLADGIALLERVGLRFDTTRLLEIYLRANASSETHFVPNFRSPMEPFTALFKICIAAGILFASPVILYQAWAFVLPALKANEKRFVLPLFTLLTLFFLFGTLFSFFVAAPLLLEMSANLWRSSDIALKPENLWTFDEYIGFLMQLVLAFGVAFELPLVMGFVSRVGWIKPDAFRRNRRYAVLILIVVAAVLTPGDIVPMAMMAGPLLLLYELGIVFAAMAARRRALMEALAETDTGEVADGA
jgi:sec-independent protein translocase protein TatC